MPVTFTIASPFASVVELPAARFAPQVSLAEVNAVRVLAALGYSTSITGPVLTDEPTRLQPTTTGTCDAVDFLGRVLLALALTADHGYLHDRLHQLLELAERAVAYGDLVIWS